MTVEEYVMVATASAVLTTAERRNLLIGHENAYKATMAVIPCVICKDGTEISVQAHWGAHTMFDNEKLKDGIFQWYAKDIGTKLLWAETDSKELDQYGMDTIEDIQACVDSHGGLDYEATIKNFIDYIHKVEEKAYNY